MYSVMKKWASPPARRRFHPSDFVQVADTNLSPRNLCSSEAAPVTPLVHACTFPFPISVIMQRFLVMILITITSICVAKHHRELTQDYYSESCPRLEDLISFVTANQFKDSPVSGPATIRLFFHDCFVDGCDGSILIETKDGNKGLAEMDAEDNKNLRREGFETVRKVKALVESRCPGTVSCADILAIATRDFIHFAGGPYYKVKTGRWDGKISLATRVAHNIPQANSTVDQLISLFTSKGLSVEDLVALSGAHTIGFAHCKQFMPRLYDFQGTNKADPNIDRRLLEELRRYCPYFGWNPDVVAPLDPTTPFSFDNAYFKNLEAKLGVLGSDQALWQDPRTRDIAENMGKDKNKFFKAFSDAMEKMGSISVKRGRRHGELRKDCSMHP